MSHLTDSHTWRIDRVSSFPFHIKERSNHARQIKGNPERHFVDRLHRAWPDSVLNGQAPMQTKPITFATDCRLACCGLASTDCGFVPKGGNHHATERFHSEPAYRLGRADGVNRSSR